MHVFSCMFIFVCVSLCMWAQVCSYAITWKWQVHNTQAYKLVWIKLNYITNIWSIAYKTIKCELINLHCFNSIYFSSFKSYSGSYLNTSIETNKYRVLNLEFIIKYYIFTWTTHTTFHQYYCHSLSPNIFSNRVKFLHKQSLIIWR